MKIEYIQKSIDDIQADVELIIVVNREFEHSFVKPFKESLESAGFSGKQDEVILLPEGKKLFVGCDSLECNAIRPAVATAIRSLIGKKYKSLKVASYLKDESSAKTMQALVEGLALGSYNFTRYKSDAPKSLQEVFIAAQEYSGCEANGSAVKEAITKGLELSLAVNLTRDIVNTPPDDFYPKIMGRVARDIAENEALECRVLDKKDISNEKMNALLAVSRASSHSPRVIHMSYKPKHPKAKVSLVGKGLTYDSGGLSLKPSDYMVTMKSDKSGGSAVLGIMQAVSRLKLPIEVHGFIGAVENMIGGDAYKPDDVLTSKSGKTIEVRNTDAEGRLVLADVLSFAQQEVEADYIIDMATLTGACVVGLGNYTIGVMGNNDALLDSMVEASSKRAGELAAKLPFNSYLQKTLKSSIADICNISNTRYGGAITAGLFLNEFIEEKNRQKWLHLDIAGPAFVEHEWGENPHGASGAGVRAVVSFLEGLNNQ